MAWPNYVQRVHTHTRKHACAPVRACAHVCPPTCLCTQTQHYLKMGLLSTFNNKTNKRKYSGVWEREREMKDVNGAKEKE